MKGKPQQVAVESTVRRLKDAAALALQKRRYEKAVEHFLALTHAEPYEPSHFIKLGDLAVRMGREALALDYYRCALDLFEKQCAYRKAVAIAIVILGLHPGEAEATRVLQQWKHPIGPARSATPKQPVFVPDPPSPIVPPAATFIGVEDDDEYGIEITMPPPIAPSPEPREVTGPPAAKEGPSAAEGWGIGNLTDGREWDAMTQFMVPSPLHRRTLVPDASANPTLMTRIPKGRGDR